LDAVYGLVNYLGSVISVQYDKVSVIIEP
jgi:hypothetical protein